MRKIVNVVSFCIILACLYGIVRIDNFSRLPENINTDYFMNSLPYIYLIIIIALPNIIFDTVQVLKKK